MISSSVFLNYPDPTVERFAQDLDEGLIEGVPKARTTCSGEWLEHYELVYNEQVLRAGQWFIDYEISANAIIYVVLVTNAIGNQLQTGSSQTIEAVPR